jgi:hypothetical protein
VAAGHESGEQQAHDFLLADEDGAELLLDGSAARAQARHVLFRHFDGFWVHGFAC